MKQAGEDLEQSSTAIPLEASQDTQININNDAECNQSDNNYDNKLPSPRINNTIQTSVLEVQSKIEVKCDKISTLENE